MAAIHPTFSEYSLGSAGWAKLHELRRQRGRNPREQALQLVRYALYQAISGHDVELTQAQLLSLLQPEIEAAA